MSTYTDISESIDDPVLVDLLSEIETVANAEAIEFFVVGAMARDLVMRYAFQIDPGRATRDIDIGVRVASWEEFDRLREGLISSGVFSAHEQSQRLLFKEVLPLDVLPFGTIRGRDSKIKWPSDDGVEMSVLGFDQAFENSIVLLLRKEPELDVRVASPVGLVMMKLIAWSDRQPATTKDAVDVGIIIRSYLELGNQDRLYNDHDDLLEDPDFDYVLAGAKLLGRDLAAIATDELRQTLIAILDKEIGGDGDHIFVYASAASSPHIEESAKYLAAIRDELCD